jgi:hypothetical protein
MIEGAYRKVLYYNLPALWSAGGGAPLTVDVSKYQFMKAFAVRVGTDVDGAPSTPVISATYYATNNSEITLTRQISSGGSPLIGNPAKSIFGNATTSGFSSLVIPNNSTWGHTLCKADVGSLSWLWFPYRLIKLQYSAPDNGNPANSGLLLLF